LAGLNVLAVGKLCHSLRYGWLAIRNFWNLESCVVGLTRRSTRARRYTRATRRASVAACGLPCFV